jgi:hypothetical protein
MHWFMVAVYVQAKSMRMAVFNFLWSERSLSGITAHGMAHDLPLYHAGTGTAAGRQGGT